MTLRLLSLLLLRASLCVFVLVAAVLNVQMYWARSVRTSDPVSSMERVEWFVPSKIVRLASVDPIAGMRSAAVTVIEIADFECPFCARSAADIVPHIQGELAQIDSSRYLFLNYPLVRLHQNALPAAQAAECAASQGRFGDMYRQLFKTPSRLQQADLVEHARLAGLNQDAFQSCLEEGTQPRISLQMSDAERLGATGTPTFVFGRLTAGTNFEMMARISGVRPVHVFKDVLQRVTAAR